MKANLFHVAWIAPLVAEKPTSVRRARTGETLALVPSVNRLGDPQKNPNPARRLTRVWDEFNW